MSTRLFEKDVRLAILNALSIHKFLTTREIIDKIYFRLQMSEDDLTRAAKRPNEFKIDQIIANALQEERFLCANRLIRRVGRGLFVITKRGRAVLAEIKKRRGQ